MFRSVLIAAVVVCCTTTATAATQDSTNSVVSPTMPSIWDFDLQRHQGITIWVQVVDQDSLAKIRCVLVRSDFSDLDPPLASQGTHCQLRLRDAHAGHFNLAVINQDDQPHLVHLSWHKEG